MPQAAPSHRTVDATPINIICGANTPDDSVARAPVMVFAFDHEVGVAVWSGVLSIRRLADGTLAFVGTLAKVASPSAAAWTVSLKMADNAIWATCTGAAGVTIDWLMMNDDPFSMVGTFGF